MNLLLGALILLSQTGPDPRFTTLESWADGFMNSALRASQMAGAVIVIVGRDHTILAKGYGYADVERRIPVDPERTGFRPGSVSKLFTATAILQLVESGKLELDRDVNEYLDFRVGPGSGPPVTVRQLLTHSAGFDQAIKGLGYVDSTLILPLPEYVRRYQPPRVYQPGTTPAYSNYGFVVSGYLIQRLSGETFEEYIQQHIFAPLGMTRSTFRQPLPVALAADMSKGYVVASGDPQPFEILGTMPAGGATTTGDDMGRFMMAHLQEGRLGDATILRPETVRLMQSPAQSPAAPPGFAAMGLGFVEGSDPDRPSVGHGGDTIAFHAGLTLFPLAGVGVYIAVNSLGSGTLVGDGVVNAFTAAFADRFLPVAPRETPAAVPTAIEHSRLAAGRYLSSRHFERSFLSFLNLSQDMVESFDDGTITIASVSDREGRPKRWRETGPWTWHEVGGPEQLMMQVTNGKVTTIRRSGDAATVLLRADGPRKAAWNLPLLILTVVVLVIEAVRRLVLWRRNTGRLQQVAFLGHLAAAAVIIGWVMLFRGLLAGDYSLLSGTRDITLRVLQALGVLAVILSPVLVVAATRPSSRRIIAKLWGAAVVISCVGLVWFAIAFRLLGPSLSY